MKFSYSSMKRAIDHFAPEVRRALPDDHLFSRIRIVEPAEQLFHSDIVYVAASSELPREYPSDQPFCVICICDEPAPTALLDDANASVLLLPQGTPQSSIINELAALLEEEDSAMDETRVLLECLLKSGDLADFMNAAANILGNPVMFSDISGNLLAESGGVTLEGQSLTRLLETGYPSIEDIHHLKQIGVYDAITKDAHPRIWGKGGYFAYNQIIAPVWADGKAVAILTVQEQLRNLTPRDLDTVERMCHMLALERQRDAFVSRTRGQAYEYFLRDLFASDSADGALTDARMERVGFHPKKFMYGLTVLPSSQTTADNSLLALGELVHSLFPGSMSVVIGGSLTCLLNSATELHPQDFTEFGSYATALGLRAGVSRPFGSILGAKTAGLESHYAAEVSHRIIRLAPVAFFAEVIPYHVIMLAEAQGGNPDHWIDSSLSRLLEHDAEHHTDYVDTLWCYLLNDRNVSRTAEAVYLHRNTLLYRRDKIERIMGRSLDDQQFRSQVIFSFYILELKGSLTLRSRPRLDAKAE